MEFVLCSCLPVQTKEAVSNSLFYIYLKLCLSTALHVCLNSAHTVAYIDSSNSFSAKRIAEMYSAVVSQKFEVWTLLTSKFLFWLINHSLVEFIIFDILQVHDFGCCCCCCSFLQNIEEKKHHFRCTLSKLRVFHAFDIFSFYNILFQLKELLEQKVSW